MKVSVNKLSFAAIFRCETKEKAEQTCETLKRYDKESIIAFEYLRPHTSNPFVIFTDEHLETYNKEKAELDAQSNPNNFDPEAIKKRNEGLAVLSTLVKHEGDMIHYSYDSYKKSGDHLKRVK